MRIRKEYADHAARAAEAREVPGESVQVDVYPTRQSALGIAKTIRSGVLTAYAPAGSFEAHIKPVEDGTAVLVCYLGEEIPARPVKAPPVLVPVPGGLFADAVAFLKTLLGDGAPLTARTAVLLLAEAGHDVAAEVVRAYVHGTTRMQAGKAALYLIERDAARAIEAADRAADGETV